MSGVTEFEIDWRREKLAKAGGGGAGAGPAPKFIFASFMSGFVRTSAQSNRVHFFSNQEGSSLGGAVGVFCRVTRFGAYIQSNTLDGGFRIALEQNETVVGEIIISAGQTGYFEVSVGVDFSPPDRISWRYDNVSATLGNIDIVSVFAVAEPT